jgi:hypothetical protein
MKEMEMWREILRVVGGTVKAFLTELFGYTKDFEFSKCVSVVPSFYLQRHVAVLLFGPCNKVYINYELSVAAND